MSKDPAKTSGSRDTHTPEAGPACVLLVEDDATVAMIVEQILLDMTLQVLVVSTLDYALVEVEMANFDAAIIDMHLRGDRADQLVDALMLGNIPFMVLSGSDQSTFHAAHPQIALLGKPFDKAELEQCVRSLLQHRQPR
ncbi:MAG: response regulator [Rhodanobacter sp.]